MFFTWFPIIASRSTRQVAARLVLSCLLVPAFLPVWIKPAPAQTAGVDLALVLAIDCSYSVDELEYNLQIGGLADAFRSTDVHSAIQSGPLGAISIAVVQWSSHNSQSTVVSWSRISSISEMHAFADQLATMPRMTDDGATAMAAAISFSAALHRANPYFATRQVIDVSADGRNNNGPNIGGARDRAVAQGITINGLAILLEDGTLDRYFSRDVIGGPGAFVEEANDYADYARAIKRKLVKEIQYAPISNLDTPGGNNNG